MVDLIDVINDDGSWDQVPVFRCAMCGAEFDVKEILDLHMIYHLQSGVADVERHWRDGESLIDLGPFCGNKAPDAKEFFLELARLMMRKSLEREKVDG